MLEAIVEGGGVLVGLCLLLYFQVLRPQPEAVTRRGALQTPGTDQVPPGDDRTDPEA